MTIMTPIRRKAKPSHRDGRAGVYHSKSARTSDPLWRDLVAGAVFFTALCVGLVIVVCGGLMIFG